MARYKITSAYDLALDRLGVRDGDEVEVEFEPTRPNSCRILCPKFKSTWRTLHHLHQCAELIPEETAPKNTWVRATRGSLRVGDLVRHYTSPDRKYKVVYVCSPDCVLVSRPPNTFAVYPTIHMEIEREAQPERFQALTLDQYGTGALRLAACGATEREATHNAGAANVIAVFRRDGNGVWHKI